MKKKTGEKYMNLTNQEIDTIRNCLMNEKYDSLKDMFWNVSECEQDSAWREYGQCRHMNQPVMRYDFQSPIELKKYLKELWEADNIFDDDLINTLIVSVFRHKQLVREEGETQEIDIPSYIYNF